MGSDRARRSYDEGRQYRRVVPQQGRVFVEADFNEAEEIRTEETRKEARDFIGPSGTPDDGYRVSVSGASSPDFSVGPGTMYVGGVRVELGGSVDYGAQAEWVDGPSPTLDEIEVSTSELVVLMLTEHEVGAVEDTALLEPALGGPDTAQRTRIVQRFERFGVDPATTCEEADAIAEPLFADARGYHFDHETMRLEPLARLLASYDTGTTEDPCAPEVQQGYLGAENQLIRVQVSSKPGDPGKILWAFDNASSLYRVVEQTTSGGKTTLTLATPPIDPQHAPRGSQRIEVLRTAVTLDAPTDYVAALTGVVAGLVGDYDPETQSITIDTVLGAEYTDASKTPVVFVRVWEEELSFTAGTPVALGKTGVQVTLSLVAYGDDEGVFALGDHWLLAVRPSTPLAVLPARYLESAQPPDGPRRWACPLAVIITGEGAKVLDDCRERFDNLVELSKRKTCCIVVGPSDVGGGQGLQTLLDEHAGHIVKLGLLPGNYALNQPLVLREEHAGLTMHACSGGVTIEAAAGMGSNFARGLVEMAYCDNVTFEGIRFDRPAGGPIQNEVYTGLGVRFAVGIQPSFCKNLTVKGCIFNFTVVIPLWSIGIFIHGDCPGLVIEDNQFFANANAELSAGVLCIPAVGLVADPVSPTGVPTYSAATIVTPTLTSSSVCRNRFTDVLLPVFVLADITSLRADENRIEGCAEGIALTSLKATGLTLAQLTSRLDVDTSGAAFAGQAVNVARLLWFFHLQLGYLFGFYPHSSYLVSSDVTTTTIATTTDSFVAYVQLLQLIDKKAPGSKVDLHICHNDIAPGGSNPIAGIFVMDTRSSAHASAADGAAIVDGNVVSMTEGAVAAAIVSVERCAVTGNVFASRPAQGAQQHPFSLIVIRGQNAPSAGTATFGRVAVTGNVLQGLASLPPRPSQLEQTLPWISLNHDEG